MGFKLHTHTFKNILAMDFRCFLLHILIVFFKRSCIQDFTQNSWFYEESVRIFFIE